MVGIDLSLRSTGIVVLNDSNTLVDFCVVGHPTLKNEDVLIFNTENIMAFLEKHQKNDIAIEGLSFMANSSSKDLLWGNFWCLRTQIKKDFMDCVNVSIIPVARWRKTVLTRDEQRSAKKTLKGKLKRACVLKLPEDVFKKFDLYIRENKLKKDAIYDLTDAYFIAKFQNDFNKGLVK